MIRDHNEAAEFTHGKNIYFQNGKKKVSFMKPIRCYFIGVIDVLLPGYYHFSHYSVKIIFMQNISLLLI